MYQQCIKKSDIKTYETVVTDVVHWRGFTDVYFIDDCGNETYIELVNRLVVFGSDFEEGAAVRVTEYTGLFDMEYCMLSDIN